MPRTPRPARLTPHLVAAALALGSTGCEDEPVTGRKEPMRHASSTAPSTTVPAPPPAAGRFTTAPLRNRIRVALAAPVPEVWALAGDLARLPEYSAGLERVEVARDARGIPTGYTCHFKPAGEGAPGLVNRDRFAWYEAPRGWASVGEEPNDFGLERSLHLVTLAPSPEGTLLTWDAHYDAQDLDGNRLALDLALADIAERLTARFGGRLLERYVDAPG